IAAVERLGRLAADRPAVRARLLDHRVDFLARADVVRERDPAPGRAVVGDTGVGGQLLARPEHEHDAVRAEERRLLDLERRRPAERLVERPGALVVGDAERDERHALLHPRTLAAPATPDRHRFGTKRWRSSVDTS